MSRPPLRFSISDLLLATLLSALPLAFKQWTGLVAALCLSMMSFALTFGYGLLALVLMCISLVSSASLDSDLTGVRSPIGAFITSVALTIVIALALRLSPRQKL